MIVSSPADCVPRDLSQTRFVFLSHGFRAYFPSATFPLNFMRGFLNAAPDVEEQKKREKANFFGLWISWCQDFHLMAFSPTRCVASS